MRGEEERKESEGKVKAKCKESGRGVKRERNERERRV
jgi:hypothetical protein